MSTLGPQFLVVADVTYESIRILIWGAVLIGALMGGFAAIRVVRRRWLGVETNVLMDWTIHDLRALRDQGALTEEEFEKLRTTAISGARGRDAAM